MSQPSADVQRTWDILKEVAASTLERKRRLGESAVIWQDGRVVITEGDMTDADGASDASARDAGGEGTTTGAAKA
jgi:hypothetical protein